MGQRQMKNEITIVREHRGRILKLVAVYGEQTDDWNVILFEGLRPIEARTTTNVFAEAADMFALALEAHG